MAFAASMVKATKKGKMSRAAGKVASSMAHKANDPDIKKRDRLKEILKILNEKIKRKYAAKARAAVMKMWYV